MYTNAKQSDPGIVMDFLKAPLGAKRNLALNRLVQFNNVKSNAHTGSYVDKMKHYLLLQL